MKLLYIQWDEISVGTLVRVLRVWGLPTLISWYCRVLDDTFEYYNN